MHHDQVKNKQKAQIKRDELDRIIKEKAYKKEKKAIRRKKTVKKIAIGTVLTAMVAISAVTVKYSQNYYKIANDTGWLGVNEIRAEEDYDAIDGLDVLKLGLGAVLYDTRTHKFYVPNTGSIVDTSGEQPLPNEGGET